MHDNLVELLAQHDLVVHNTEKTVFCKGSRPTFIDHIRSNLGSAVEVLSTNSPPLGYDHKYVLASINLQVESPKARFVRMRNWKALTVYKLESAILYY